jgi:hypothetical protein
MLDAILNNVMSLCGIVFFGSIAILMLLFGVWAIGTLIKSIKHDFTCPHGHEWFGDVDNCDY